MLINIVKNKYKMKVANITEMALKMFDQDI